MLRLAILMLIIQPGRGVGANLPGPAASHERRLYVAVPGIRNYLDYGGHGLLVYDIDHGHRLIKRIPTAGLDAKGVPNNVKGICASALTKRVYISTIQQLMCLDLVSEKLLWERQYEGGCDRMSITPDGRLIYVPSFEGAFWNVVRGEDGEIVAKLVTNSASHNTIIGAERRRGLSRGAPFASPGRDQHQDPRDSEDGRSVRREHSPVHSERPPDAQLRQRQRLAGL